MTSTKCRNPPLFRFSLYGMWSHIQPFYASVFDDPTTASYVVAFVVIAVGAPACVVGGLLADRCVWVVCQPSLQPAHRLFGMRAFGCNIMLCICLRCPY